MKLFNTIAAAALVVSFPAFAANYTLDASHTNARFTIDHFGTSSNVGAFYNLEGSVKYDAKAKTGFVDVTLPLKNLDTGRSAFTEHLRGDGFFKAAKYPNIRFVSEVWNFDASGKVTSVDGKLTMVGKTYPVTLKATKFGCYDSAMLKKQVCGGDFEATIDRTQWGIDQYVQYMPASRYVKLNIQIEAAKQ